MEKKLQGQVAIVTGASSGIGAGVSKSLAAAGATVVVNYPVASNKGMADDVVKEITGAGNSATSAQCDVSKEDEVIKMFADVVKEITGAGNSATSAHCSYKLFYRQLCFSFHQLPFLKIPVWLPWRIKIVQ